jgi:hypothetical protein
VSRTARRLGRRGAVACSEALDVRIDAARAQLECVASDAARARP